MPTVTSGKRQGVSSVRPYPSSITVCTIIKYIIFFVNFDKCVQYTAYLPHFTFRTMFKPGKLLYEVE